MNDNQLTELKNEFTIWYTYFSKPKHKQTRKFEEILTKVGTFKTAEEFWGINQHMKKPDTLTRGCQFYLFRKNIRPIWEDKENLGGGRFFVNINNEDIKKANQFWEDLMISFLLTYDGVLGKICGVVLNKRVSEIIFSIWTKDIDKDEQERIRQWFGHIFGFDKNRDIEFKKHSDGSKGKEHNKYNSEKKNYRGEEKEIHNEDYDDNKESDKEELDVDSNQEIDINKKNSKFNF